MVRIKLPCMSGEAHGAILPGVVFATNRYGQYLKFFVPRKRKGTEAQKKVRHAYGEVATRWRGMSDIEKRIYEDRGKEIRRTGYNQFFHEKFHEEYEP